MKSIAVALGAGGARGLAHIAVLEALDDMGVTPVAIAGSSIGALIGAAYACGMSGRAIRRHVLGLVHNRAEVFRRVLGARAEGGRFWTSPFANPVLVDGERLTAGFLPDAVPDDFSALAIPLAVVAADLYGRHAVEFTAGPLRPALAASMAVPGLVRPVMIGHRVLVDGGAVDPLPFAALADRADIVVGVDCSAAGAASRERIPDPWECIFATITVMGQTIVAEKLKHSEPDLLLRPNVGRFRLLDFLLASAILRAAEPIKVEIKMKLGALIAS